jgi:FkbM family methyltransferase
MVNYTFAKQVGIINFILRVLYIKIKKKFITEKFIYRTLTKKKYYIHKWDPFGTEVFITSNFTDWGNEYLFLNSVKQRNKNIFLDVGCHSGYFLTSFKDLFRRSIGFEPSLKCCALLQKNQLEFINCFVGMKSGFQISCENYNGYSFYQQAPIKNSNATKIPLITLDDFYYQNNLKDVTAIKIDVDGNDFDVLFGAKKIITKDRPSILIEHYSKKLFEFFQNLDYSLVSLISTKNKPFNLQLKIFDKYEPDIWTKMICCIPNEYKLPYLDKKFDGNLFFGINKKKILEKFNF